MIRTVLVLLLIGVFVRAEDAVETPTSAVQHQITLETSLRSVTYVAPLDYMIGASYRYYFPSEDSVQKVLSGGFHFTPIISEESLAEGANYLFFYTEFGFEFTRVDSKRTPRYALRVGPTFSMEEIRGKTEVSFEAIELGFVGDIWQYSLPKGNLIGFMNPRVNIIFSGDWSHFIPGFEVVLFSYGFRF